MASPPETQLGGLYQQFIKNKHLSPVNGLLILKSGVLANVRFHGNYGPQQQNILCHYQITHPPQNIVATSDKDCPQDYTTALVQQLFPSPAGGRLSLPGPQYDFFRLLPLKNIKELLLLYSSLKEQNASPDKSYPSFYQLFQSWLMNSKEQGGLLSKNSRKSLANLWDKSDKEILEKLSQHYAQIFAQSLSESDYYPKHFVESSLLAFAWRKAKTIQDLLDDQEAQVREFTYQDYEKWKQKALINHRVKTEAFQDLLKKPEHLIFFTIAYDLYDNPYPLLLGTGKAFYSHQDELEPFSDCGESALRNFFNIMLADPESKTFDSHLLKTTFPNVAPNLLTFYTNIQQKYVDVTDDLTSRSLWANVVSNLNHPDDQLQILYGNSEGRCNLKGTGGMDTLLAVIEKLLNDKELTKIRLSGLEPNSRRAQLLTYILTKFSRTGAQFSWHVKGESNALKNHGDVTIAVNGQDLFTWHISPSHFDFKVIHSEKGNDWRKHSDVLSQLLESDLDLSLKSHLLPFYLGSTVDKVLSQKDHYQSFTPEILFGLPLTSGEQMVSALDIALSINPKINFSLAFKWLTDLPDALAVNHLVAKLISKHKEIFDPQIGSSSNPSLKIVFSRIINSLKRLDGVNLFEEVSKYLKIPGFDQLMIDVLKEYNAEQLVSLKNKGKETLLHIACKRGRLPFAEFLLTHAGPQLLDKKPIKAHEGITPLHLAAAKGHDSIVKLLMENKITRPIFLNPSNIKDATGSTPLHLAIRNKRDKVVSRLLNDTEFRTLMLSPNHVQDAVVGYSPLHLAAKNGDKETIKLLLSDTEAAKVLLDERHWYSLPHFETDEKMTPIDLTTDETIINLLKAAKNSTKGPK
jgi:ankyrin repeat protein